MVDRCVIIDNGSGSIKAGFNEADKPQIAIPTLVGTSRSAEEPGVVAVGDEANERRGELQIRSAIHRGLITEWDDMELLWGQVLKNLDVDRSDVNVVLTEPLFNSAVARQRMFEVWFEKFDAKNIASCTQPLLSFLTTGCKTGLIVEIGEGIVQICSVVNDIPIVKSFGRHNFAGMDITDNAIRLLAFRGHPFRTSQGREIVRDIKEQLCYAAFDPREESAVASSSLEQHYRLPDGTLISIADERHLIVEPLFRPSLLGVEVPGLHQLIYNTIMNDSPIDARRELFGNIFVCGGSSLFPGLLDRLQRELVAIALPSVAVKVSHCALPTYTTWLGACVLSLLGTSRRNVWLSSESYNEEGVNRARIFSQTCASPYN